MVIKEPFKDAAMGHVLLVINNELIKTGPYFLRCVITNEVKCHHLGRRVIKVDYTFETERS